MGISGFVVDWYGDREPFIDQSYAVMQNRPPRTTSKSPSCTTKPTMKMAPPTKRSPTSRCSTTLTSSTVRGPRRLSHLPGPAGHLHLPQRRAHRLGQGAARCESVEPGSASDPGEYARQVRQGLRRFYAWVNAGPEGWEPDGSNWGEQYSQRLLPDHGIKVLGQDRRGRRMGPFDDSKGFLEPEPAYVGALRPDVQRHLQLLAQGLPANDPPPFLLVETWNDHEEGTAIEGGIPTCDSSGAQIKFPSGPLIRCILQAMRNRRPTRTSRRSTPKAGISTALRVAGKLTQADLWVRQFLNRSVYRDFGASDSYNPEKPHRTIPGIPPSGRNQLHRGLQPRVTCFEDPPFPARAINELPAGSSVPLRSLNTTRNTLHPLAKSKGAAAAAPSIHALSNRSPQSPLGCPDVFADASARRAYASPTVPYPPGIAIIPTWLAPSSAGDGALG